MQAVRSQGFTLVELLIVTAILGIVALAAIPFLSSADPQRLDAAARSFADAIRFARDEAVRTGAPYGFTVTPSQRRIRVFRADMSGSPPSAVYDVYHPVSKKPFDIDLRAETQMSVDTLAATSSYRGACNTTEETVFDSRGRAYCRNPYPVFCRQARLTLSLAGHNRVLTLDGFTGRVTIQ